MYLLYSNTSAYAKQRLTTADKLPVTDGVDDVSSSVMHMTLTLLLRYQRLLVSQFIAADKSRNVDDVLSLSGISIVCFFTSLDVADCMTDITNCQHVFCRIFLVFL